MTEENISLPPIKVAFIIDNKVVDVLHTDERLAAIFLSNPLVVDVTGEDGNQTAFLNDIYDPETKTFSKDSMLVDFVEE